VPTRSSLKSRTALTTVYPAGLRVSEVVLLKIADIDSQRMVIRIEQGKGGKDRYVMLSPQLRHLVSQQPIESVDRNGCSTPRVKALHKSTQSKASLACLLTAHLGRPEAWLALY
jgi:site-specific recombinase XerD